MAQTDMVLIDNEKKAALQNFLLQEGRIRYAGTSEPQLLGKLVDVLIHNEMLCGKALNHRVTFVLYPGHMLSDVVLYNFEQEEHEIIVPVAPNSPDMIAQLGQAINVASEKKDELAKAHSPSMPLSEAQRKINPSDFIEFDNDNRPNMNRPAGKRGHYDPRAETLPEGKAHTWGHLLENGRAREGKDLGGNYIRKLELAYLLSDEALHSKAPNRWFRDICVVCGISTNLLEHITGIGQTYWSKLQNKHIPAETHMHYLFKALNIISAIPIHTGRGEGAGSYIIPAGALFELKTVEHKNAEDKSTTVINPEELNRIAMGLFKKPFKFGKYTAVEYQLKRLMHIAAAYKQDAISKEEIISVDMHCIINTLIKEYQRAFTEFTLYDKNFFRNVKSKGIIPVINELTRLNKNYLHIPEPVFECYIQSLKWFLKAEGQNLKTSGKYLITPDEAFTFCTNHHDGTSMGNFIKNYRKMLDQTLEETGIRKNVVKEAIRKLETESSNENLLAHALFFSNPWMLPEENGRIALYVRDYLEKFEKHKKRMPHESHWLTLAEVFEQYSGKGGRELIGVKNITAKILNDSVKNSPQELFRLIILPSDQELLVKCEQGQPPRLLDTQAREWVISLIHPTQTLWAQKVNNAAKNIALG